MPAPHLRACRLHRLNAAQAVRAGHRRSADPAGHRSAAPAGHRNRAGRAVLHRVTSADPADPADRAVRPRVTSADPADPAVRPRVTSADPADPADPAVRPPVTSADPTTTTGDHHGTPGTTTGAVDSTVPLGVMICRPGAGVRRRHRRGMDRCQRRGDRLRRQSTTGASRSSRCGIPVTTSGASTSSGSGFRSRSDLLIGRPPRMHWGWSSSRANSLERVTDRQVLESADERGRHMLRRTGQLDGLQSRQSVKKLFTSMRANAAPRQKCTPYPKAMCLLGSRATSNTNGSSKTSSSRLPDT